MSKASEIMNTEVIKITSDAMIDEAIKILSENKISGLPVVDDENRVIGIITEKDIIEYSAKLQVIPLIGFSGWVSPYKDVSEIATIKEGIELLSKTEVSKVMSKKIISVVEDASWRDVVLLMKKNAINRVPVLDKEGKLKGIIARADILNYLEIKLDDI